MESPATDYPAAADPAPTDGTVPAEDDDTAAPAADETTGMDTGDVPADADTTGETAPTTDTPPAEGAATTDLDLPLPALAHGELLEGQPGQQLGEVIVPVVSIAATRRR